MSMKNSNDAIGNRTRNLPARSAVPQPTAPPRNHLLGGPQNRRGRGDEGLNLIPNENSTLSVQPVADQATAVQTSAYFITEAYCIDNTASNPTHFLI